MRATVTKPPATLWIAVSSASSAVRNGAQPWVSARESASRRQASRASTTHWLPWCRTLATEGLRRRAATGNMPTPGSSWWRAPKRC